MIGLGAGEIVILLLLLVIPLLTAVLIGVGGILVYRSRTRRCPHCAERIRNEATVCRYCGRDVPPVVTDRTRPG